METRLIPKRVAIIGASGSIGQSLLASCRQAGWPVVGTGYQHLSQGLQRFDLRRDSVARLLPGLGRGDVVYLLSALTHPDQVAQQPELARELNLTASCRLAAAVLNAGARLICLSSTQVFDGQTGGYTESSPCAPLNLYGRLKQEFEVFLGGQAGDWMLLRTDAVIAPQVDSNCPVEKTYRSLWGGEAWMAEDNLLSLTGLDDLCRVLQRLASPAPSQLYHVAGSGPVSRVQLADWIRQYSCLGRQMDFLPCKFVELRFLESRPRATWLDGSKLTEELDIVLQKPEELVAAKVTAIDRALAEQGPWWE